MQAFEKLLAEGKLYDASQIAKALCGRARNAALVAKVHAAATSFPDAALRPEIGLDLLRAYLRRL